MWKLPSIHEGPQDRQISLQPTTNQIDLYLAGITLKRVPAKWCDCCCWFCAGRTWTLGTHSSRPGQNFTVWKPKSSHLMSSSMTISCKDRPFNLCDFILSSFKSLSIFHFSLLPSYTQYVVPTPSPDYKQAHSCCLQKNNPCMPLLSIHTSARCLWWSRWLLSPSAKTHPPVGRNRCYV